MTIYIVYEMNDYTEDQTSFVTKIYTTQKKASSFLEKELLDARKRPGFLTRGKCNGSGDLCSITLTDTKYANCHSVMWIEPQEIE